MRTENTWPNSDSADFVPGGEPFALLRGGPVILLPVEAERVGSPAGMQCQLDLVRDVSQRLDAVEIGYMLTGSMALNCYGLPCLPRNLDFVVALHPAEAEMMVRLFAPDYDVSREAVDSAIAEQTAFNLIHRGSRLKVNCIICRQIKYRLIEFSRRQRLLVENFKTWVVSKEDLIISKLHWIRQSPSERHLRDVRALIATGCDSDYIDRWTEALGIFKLWQECLAA
ncbi:MAG TPA: hypothetical protein VMB80_08740 [Candidatus Acidoferrum sp.]|nr:hypothetical protein [Candidatus Acidoferrum sp.]